MINIIFMLDKIKLTKKQEQSLLQIKRHHKSAIVRDRAQVILALSKGLNITAMVKAFSRSNKFIKNAVALFKRNKLDKTRYDSNNHKLKKGQRTEIIKMIEKKSPDKLKEFNFKDQFWTTDTLRQIIKKKYNVIYKTEKSYYDLFKAAGFSFHKPKTRDFRQDPAKTKEFKGALKKSSSVTKIRLSW